MRTTLLPTLTVITILAAALCALWLVVGAAASPEPAAGAALSDAVVAA
jgi:hypothetical protein